MPARDPRLTAVLLLVALGLPKRADAGIALAADAGYDPAGVVFTVDPEAANPGARAITNARNLRQTFQLAEAVEVGRMVLSVALNGTPDELLVRIHEVADVTSGTWSAGALVHSFRVPTGGLSSAATIALEFSGADVFRLPARSGGMRGYGIELTQAGATSIGSVRHSNSGTDLFAPGNYYTESGNAGSSGGINTTRDLGLSISGSPPGDDVDDDGLDDTWEDRHFGDGDGNATAAELALEDGSGDPDGDGLANEAEESAGTDPNDVAAFPGGPAILYVAHDGSDANPGTIDRPFATVARAQQAAAPGTTVYFRGGTHAIDVGQVAQYSSIFARVFVLDRSGTEAAPIRYWAYPGEQPVFDLTAVNPAGYRIYTFHVTGDWLHFRGLTVTGVQVNIPTHTQSICFDNQGSHNLYERLVMRDNQAIGLWIGNGSHNLVLNCDAYRNWDYTSEGGVGGNVDGFGCHVGSGDVGNVFRGCRAWLNSDDGFDCITCREACVIERCWAFHNGYDPSFVSRGDGNGFKAGGYGSWTAAQLPNPIPRHVVRDCLAVGNKQSGFYANHHPGGVTFTGNTALRNRRNFNLLGRTADNQTDVPGYDHHLRNNVGLNATTGELTDADLSACDSSHNYWDLPVGVGPADFRSLDEALLTAPRQPDGELPVVPLMRLAPGSGLIDRGQSLGGPYAGTAPDLGCHEADAIDVGNRDFSRPLVSTTSVVPRGHVWAFSGDAGVKPDGGAQVAYLAGDGALEQGFDGFEPGETYHVRLTTAAASGSAAVELRLDGVPLGVRRAEGAAYAPLDLGFTATAPRHELRIAATGTADEARIAVVAITRVDAGSDTDRDGLGDAWEFAWFGDLRQDAAGDFDHDGTSEVVEQALALDPTSAGEAFRGRIGGGGRIEWPGAAGLTFTVQRSTTLGDWSDIATVEGVAPVTGFTDPDPPAGRAFYRVRFTP